jgi:hypothetical protein
MMSLQTIQLRASGYSTNSKGGHTWTTYLLHLTQNDKKPQTDFEPVGSEQIIHMAELGPEALSD